MRPVWCKSSVSFPGELSVCIKDTTWELLADLGLSKVTRVSGDSSTGTASARDDHWVSHRREGLRVWVVVDRELVRCFAWSWCFWRDSCLASSDVVDLFRESEHWLSGDLGLRRWTSLSSACLALNMSSESEPLYRCLRHWSCTLRVIPVSSVEICASFDDHCHGNLRDDLCGILCQLAPTSRPLRWRFNWAAHWSIWRHNELCGVLERWLARYHCIFYSWYSGLRHLLRIYWLKAIWQSWHVFDKVLMWSCRTCKKLLRTHRLA